MHSRRRGFSLIEMIVVLTVGSVLVGVCVAALHSLLRMEQTGRDRVPRARSMAGLAQRFRDDVHEASDMTVAKQQAQWRFDLPDGRAVVYRAVPGEVRWEEQVAGKVTRQESFTLPDGASAAIDLDNESSPPMAWLIVAQSNAAEAQSGPPEVLSPGRETRVVAVLGKDRRFTHSPGGR